MSADDGTTVRLPSFRGRRNLREEITETLRGAVISGEMKPGAVYSAPSLAEQFGVSPTPVREALLDLAKEGLVEVVRNKGFRVTALSPKDLDDITELRALIEPPTVRRITEQGVSAETLERLRPLAAGIEKAAARRDFIAHVTIDMQFHLALLELAGNPRLLETVKSLRTSSRIYGLRMLPEGGALFSSSHEHTELLDLIEAGDADGAEALMRRHIGHVRGIWSEKNLDADHG
ncbi:GntR family transcriptional regulator [Streptomyces hygroscopicus subsp. hygroscopicus]|uniref:GntR family transcriptional regulator n=1 Tax=Streptomyces hygroscopicus TaxID=1912 RepID=UPI001C65B1AA|nr:GntR family transcriptional regulator [Streptomyces hygroscopicus]MBW8090429.1 GntR family transcriptional regulator [Streptomyces hygroscopicus subsp. hygroscopicus]